MISSTSKVAFFDTGLLLAMLDEEAEEDFRINKNFGIYNGASGRVLSLPRLQSRISSFSTIKNRNQHLKKTSS